MRTILALVACIAGAGCVRSNLVTCGDQLCPVGKVCGPSDACVDPDQLSACASHADGDECSYLGLTGHCTTGVCEAQTCGDGKIDAPEQCEGPDLNGATCLTYGFYEPDGLACGADCLADTTQCSGRCGDGVKNGPELCDTLPGDVFTCSEVGFDYGSVTCSPALCAPLYNGCSLIGWRRGVQHGDYSPAAYSPKFGDVYIINGGNNGYNYLHVTGSATSTVPTPTGCTDYDAGIWASTTEEVFLSSVANVCQHVDNTWTLWPMPAGVQVHRIWGTSSHDLYAIGTQAMHFDGTTWSQIDPGAPAGTVFANLYGRIGGKLAVTTTKGGVSILDGGVWTYQMVAPNTLLDHVWVSPSSVVYAVGGGKIYTNVTGAWATLDIPNIGAVQNLWGVSDTALYILTTGIWHYDGTTAIPVANPDYYSYFGGGPDNLLAVGVYYQFWESSGFLWSPYTPTTNPITAIWGFGRTNVIALGGSHVSKFDGTTWAESTLPAVPGTIEAMWAADPNFMVAVGSAGSILNFDSAWHNRTIAGTLDFHGVWAESKTRIFAVGDTGGYTPGVIYYSANGVNWSLVYTAPVGGSPFTAVWGSAATGTFVIGGTSDQMMYLPPGAAPTAWTSITMPDVEATGIWGDGDQLVVSFSDRKVYRRTSNTWEQLPTRLQDAPGKLIGPPGDVFGVSTGQLVHWDGGGWDRVRVPANFDTTVQATFSGNGVVAIGGPAGVLLMVRPH